MLGAVPSVASVYTLRAPAPDESPPQTSHCPRRVTSPDEPLSQTSCRSRRATSPDESQPLRWTATLPSGSRPAHSARLRSCTQQRERSGRGGAQPIGRPRGCLACALGRGRGRGGETHPLGKVAATTRRSVTTASPPHHHYSITASPSPPLRHISPHLLYHSLLSISCTSFLAVVVSP